MSRVLIKLLLVLLLFPQGVVAEGSAEGQRTIRIIGRNEVTVTTPEVRLGDLANVTSRFIRDDDMVIGLKKVFLVKSPDPGKTVTITAAQALNRLREEGVQIAGLGYALPRIMKVTRASREVTRDEILAVLEEALAKSGDTAELKGIEYSKPVHVVPGVMELSVEGFSRSSTGNMQFRLLANVDGAAPARFQIGAAVDEWVQVPVARRPLLKGSVVNADDLMMARLNLNTIPSDTAHSATSIIGLETSSNITYGEVFRKKKLAIPPLIESGARITMIYESKFLKATATGTALESGAEGQLIRIRNDASKKVVTGKIIEPGLVRISQ
jgi:flagella basal body P-ring formation protein FlgA